MHVLLSRSAEGSQTTGQKTTGTADATLGVWGVPLPVTTPSELLL